MRYSYPKNWHLYSREMKGKWLRTEGKRQNEMYIKAQRELLDDIESGKFKGDKELPF